MAVFLVFSLQCDRKAFGNESFTQVLDALSSAEKRIGDLLVFPVRTLGIGFEEDVVSPDFLRSAFEFFDDIEAGLSFVGGQSDKVNLGHRKPPC